MEPIRLSKHWPTPKSPATVDIEASLDFVRDATPQWAFEIKVTIYKGPLESGLRTLVGSFKADDRLSAEIYVFHRLTDLLAEMLADALDARHNLAT